MINNLIQLLQHAQQQYPNQVAQLQKSQGRWQPRSYQELLDEIQCFASGLKSLDVQLGDRVALISRTRAEWVLADYAIMSIGAVTVPIYPSLPPDQVAFILEDCGARLVIVEEASQLQMVPPGYSIVLLDGHWDGAKTWMWLHETGVVQPMRDWEDTVRNITRDTLATLVYTSGTTGRPKGVMLTHGNILANIEGFAHYTDRYPNLSVGPSDVALSFLPLSHILERMAHAFLLSRGVTIAYCPTVDDLAEYLQEIRPTMLVAVPRVFEKVHARVLEQIGGQPALPQRIFKWALSRGQQRYQYALQGVPTPPLLRRQLGLADRLVFRKIRAAMGGRLRFAISGGAPLGRDLGQFFYALGVTVVEGYGLTETAPVLTVNRPDPPQYGTVGFPLDNVTLKIADDGEILARGPNVMTGYWNLPEATALALEDGWFHTGDIGEIAPDGCLTVTDRKKYLIVLSTGKNVAPALVESRLTLSPYIDQALVIGNQRKFLGALLYLNPGRLRQWGESRQLDPDSTLALLSHPDLYPFIMAEVARVTQSLAPFERPKRVRFLPHELTEESGELTPSLKIKVPVVLDHYRTLVDDLYAQELPGSAESPELNQVVALKTPKRSHGPIVLDLLGSVVLGAIFGLLLKGIL